MKANRGSDVYLKSWPRRRGDIKHFTCKFELWSDFNYYYFLQLIGPPNTLIVITVQSVHS